MSDKSQTILVVEDDPNLREAISDTLELAGRPVLSAPGGEEALDILAREKVSIVVSDVRMMPMDGITLLKEIRLRHPRLPVLLMTAYADVDRAVEAMRSGACDFLLKPFEPGALLAQVDKYALPDPGAITDVVAYDPASANLFGIAARVAQTDATVLLTGESGVGKEVVARFIHRNSSRAQGPFVAINCAAIPESLLEATLFGYEKGAFTGAQSAQAGKFEQAQDGTLLLDEVTEMPLVLQAKLLRVLQEREVERVGGKKPVSLNIRIVATSNRDMAEAVSKGVFREDLYYRLNVFPILIPALRQRPEDIVPLARHFLVEHGVQIGRQGLVFSSPAEQALRAHLWPGNVRELENVVQRAMILAPGNLIGPEHLGLQARPLSAMPVAQAVPLESGLVPVGVVSGAVEEKPQEPGKKVDNMKDLEREHILKTLAEVNGSRKVAVERLGISERTLRYKLKQYKEEGYFQE
ncbi:sigma-54 dependent transcriptional regulator [Azovibrio restrictus]|uniref:sigma-54-dependent transcriptional regulator n=1 Tax=Azovibrio restrictus TaxID=146938 RepID=UPI0026F34D64|nr:sigma-54 dependent transcriptional regulator [Azovibrio restrictus]MDD3481949.1 sigma-54 dependent transcriptional regulator [Azovibrio restrictus]